MRKAMWERLGRDEVDLLVIGGGITGTGIAREAALRGLSVALVEEVDLAFGTSSRSSKLVHGGFRYLEQGQIGMVFESVSERAVLMKLAPHLVTGLGFLFPVYEHSRHGVAVINAGVRVYDVLSLFRAPGRPSLLSPSDLREEEPALGQAKLKGAPRYYDCATDDARLTLETALSAQENGATICTGARVVSFLKNRDGLIVGAEVEDALLGGSRKSVRARCVISAAGPWTDKLRELSHLPGVERRKLLRTTKGVHIVVHASRLPLGNAIVMFHPTDERVLFAIPWGSRTYIGTTDTDYRGNPAAVAADQTDVDYLLAAANAYFPDSHLGHADVISTWAGLRPLIAPEREGMSESSVSREHELEVGGDGLVTIAGGKLTTYRLMARDVVNTALQELRGRGVSLTHLHECDSEAPLPGAIPRKVVADGQEVWAAANGLARLAKLLVDRCDGCIGEDSALLLAHTYGVRCLDICALLHDRPELAKRLHPEEPEIEAQVVFALTHEFASTVSDVLIRRTQVFFRHADQGLSAALRVAELVAQTTQLPFRVVAQQAADYRAEVQRSRAWKIP